MNKLLFVFVLEVCFGCSKQETKVDVEESNAHYQLGRGEAAKKAQSPIFHFSDFSALLFFVPW